MGLWDSIRNYANPVNLVRDINDSSVGRTLQNHLNPANLVRDLGHTRLADFAQQGLRNFGHDISAEWKGEGMFGGRIPQINFGLGNYNGRKNSAIAAAIIGTAGAAGAFGGAGAGAGPGAGSTMGGPLGALAPVAGGGSGVGFGSLAGSGLGGASIAGVGGADMAVAAGTPWYNTFLGQTGINTGLNLLGGALQNRAQSKADEANRKAIEDRIRQALAALSPEHIMALAQQFLPQMAANMSTAGQTAIQQVREQAARTGQLESPRALSFEAGTRAKLAGDTQQAAFDRAFNVAGNQASSITGAPYAQQQPRAGFADAINNSVNQAYFARAMSQRPQQPTAPYNYPSNMNVGSPQQWERNQMEGTPYQWPFYSGGR